MTRLDYRPDPSRIRRDSKTPAIRHHKARTVACPLCGAAPSTSCVSINKVPVRPHLERIKAWEAKQ